MHRAENPGPHPWVVFMWAALAVVVLVTVGIFGAMVAMGKISVGGDSSTSQSAPAPEETGVIDPSYSVLVLNATDSPGLAAAVGDTVIAAGWSAENVTTGNVDDATFEETTIYYASEADREAAVGLAGVLGGVRLEESDFYVAEAEDNTLLLTIVIGADRVPTPDATEPGSE